MASELDELVDELLGGLEHEFYDFLYFGKNLNWQTHIFQWGRSTTNQWRDWE